MRFLQEVAQQISSNHSISAILYDSDDDIPGDTFSSGEFYESLSVVIEETEEEEECQIFVKIMFSTFLL